MQETKSKKPRSTKQHDDSRMKNMDIVQMQKALEKRAAALGRIEVYRSLHKVICKHVEKLQSRMKAMMGVNPADSNLSEHVHAKECMWQNDAQQDACLEILDILLSKINESAKAFEEWNKNHSESGADSLAPQDN